MNNANICVFDFETGGINPDTCCPLFIAAKIYHARTLEQLPGAEFKSLMKPEDGEWKGISSDALKLNRITIDELKTAPDRKTVWKQFCAFVDKFNPKSNNVWTAPIAAGMNILNYDLIIVDRLCKEIGRLDKEGKSNLFNRKLVWDLLQILGLWYENSPILDKLNMDVIREHFGMSKEEAHGANWIDTDQEAELILRFIRLHRNLFDKVPGLKGKI